MNMQELKTQMRRDELGATSTCSGSLNGPTLSTGARIFDPPLRHALAESAHLRALLAEYSAYGLAVPDGLTAEFKAAQARVKTAAAEDRRQRLQAARAEVDRLRSQKERLAETRERLERIENETRERLERIENETRAAEGK